MGVVKFLTAVGLFIGQSEDFFELLRDLAEDADEARRACTELFIDSLKAPHRRRCGASFISRGPNECR